MAEDLRPSPLPPETIREGMSYQLSLALGRVIEKSERVAFIRNHPREIITTTQVEVDSPSRHGFLPSVEQRRQIEGALSGKAAPAPTRYGLEPVDVEHTDIKLEEEEVTAVPKVTVALFLGASINELLDAERKKAILDRSEEIIEMFPYLQKSVQNPDLHSLGLAVGIKLKSLGGTVIRPVNIFGEDDNGKIVSDPDGNLNTQDINDRIKNAYEEALRATIGIPTEYSTGGEPFNEQSFLSSNRSADLDNRLFNLFEKFDIGDRGKYFPGLLCIDIYSNVLDTRIFPGYKVHDEGQNKR